MSEEMLEDLTEEVFAYDIDAEGNITIVKPV